MPASYLVTGATGYQGGATARALLKAGATVHALVRNPDAPAALALKEGGSILFKGDFDDVGAIRAATAGVVGVFLNTASNWEDPTAELRQANNFVTAAKEAGTVTTMVVSTVVKTTEHPAWVAKDPKYVLADYFGSNHAIEQAVRTAGLKHYTVLRPAWLMHNFIQPASKSAFPEMTEGRLGFASTPETSMPHFSAEDVGKFAAAALLEPERFNGHELELGIGGMTVDGIVKTVSEVSGVPVEAKYYGLEEAFGLLQKTPALAFDILAREVDMNIDDSVLEKYGIPLTSFPDFLRERKGLLMQALGKGE